MVDGINFVVYLDLSKDGEPVTGLVLRILGVLNSDSVSHYLVVAVFLANHGGGSTTCTTVPKKDGQKIPHVLFPELAKKLEKLNNSFENTRNV